MRYITLFSSVFILFAASITFAQRNNNDKDQSLADAYSTCLKGAVQAERRKRAPKVEVIKSVCEKEIAVFHASLPNFARSTVIEQLDEKLAQELR